MISCMSQAVMLLVMTSCIMLVTSSKRSWSQWSDDEGDNWNRRSCASTDQRCSTRVTCCHPSDICIGQYVARCTRMDSLRSFEAKPTNAECKSSYECADGCCREFAQHRVGIFYRCDAPRNVFHAYRCV